ncbi:hypothetical protein Dimus_010165, partial [Dionaea muscipula]
HNNHQLPIADYPPPPAISPNSIIFTIKHTPVSPCFFFPRPNRDLSNLITNEKEDASTPPCCIVDHQRGGTAILLFADHREEELRPQPTTTSLIHHQAEEPTLLATKNHVSINHHQEAYRGPPPASLPTLTALP